MHPICEDAHRTWQCVQICCAHCCPCPCLHLFWSAQRCTGPSFLPAEATQEEREAEREAAAALQAEIQEARETVSGLILLLIYGVCADL